MSLRSTGHGLHLLAAYRALARQLEEAEGVGVRGRAPGSGGKQLTPLPDALWAEIGPRLTRIQELGQAIARRHAEESMRQEEVRQPLSATLRWMSLLLRHLEETIEDLDPEVISRKFGPFQEEDELERLKAERDAMRLELANAQSALDTWREAHTKRL